MKKTAIKLLACSALLSVVACASPTTARPMGSADEIRNEAQQQSTYVQGQQKLSREQMGDLSTAAVKPRMQNVAQRVVPTAQQLCRELRINDPKGCAYEIIITEGKKNAQGVVEPDTSLNAYADGSAVYFSPAMINFASRDQDLAFIVAHEFAHNMMSHVNSKMQNTLVGTLLGVAADMAAASQGFNTQGQFGQLGGSFGSNVYSPAFESEADYVGLYLLARAGYEYHNVPEFWRRMSVENPRAIYTTTTHPSNAELFVNMNKTIAEIDYKKANNLPLVPEFQQR
jgi:predicted Zn-dependent protease